MIKLKDKFLDISDMKHSIYSNIIGIEIKSSALNVICRNLTFCDFYLKNHFKKKYD